MKRLELFLNRLYQRAKDDPYRRFHSLHDKICRLDVLEEAWKSVEANHGAAGIDGNTIEDIREYGVEKFLSELREELIGGRYEVSSLKRVYIPKANGKQRPLGIPTVKDRIVQQAVKMIMEPIFEADFKYFSFGYRHGKSAKEASNEITRLLNYGLANVISIDIKGFFDHVNHEKLMFFVSKRIADPYILKLIREWLRAGIVFEDKVTYPVEGTPQGGVISPLLANIYLNELDTIWIRKGMDRREGRNAHIIRYADDIIVLTDGRPEYPMTVIKSIISALDLELNDDKTDITTAKEGFDFLGFRFIRKMSEFRKKEVTYVYPAVESVARFRNDVSEILQRRFAHVKPIGIAIKQLNSLIRGWYNYYRHTNASMAFKRLQKFIDWKVMKYYCFIHKIRKTFMGKEMYRRTSKLGLTPLTGKIYRAQSILPEAKHTG